MTKTIRNLFLSGAAAAALAACAGFEAPTPNFPIDVNDYRPAPTAAQVQAASQQTPAPPVEDGPRAVPTSRIASAELSPPPAAAAQSQPAPSQSAASAPAPVQPKPAAASPIPASTGEVAVYVIQPGDTLSGVARRFGTPLKTLVELNGLGPEGAVKAGQKVKVPASAVDKGTDPYATGPAPTRLASAPPVRVVEQGSSAPAPITPKPQVQPVAPKPQTPTPAPATSSPAPKPTPPMVSSSPAPGDADIVRLGRGKFVWPVTGDVLSRFGAFGQGLKNDGVNIAAPAGTPVKSTAAGEVVYAGNSVPGFGNLVLVKHADGWVSAYGHLAAMTVKMKDRVSQGQEIGQVGQTGGVDRPQVHFELRYAPTVRDRAKPVDPMLVLP
ncbi:MAG TPA: M23 family metallopeptidase [Caulobacteraceae bacterium]|nr:M23 family metallopeptidase [Caulobacteraceae bacterium]